MMFSSVFLTLALAEVYSDLTLSHDFQERQLKKRHDHFWSVVESAVDTEDYVAAAEGLFACLDDVPDGPTKPILRESVEHLQIAAAGAAAQNDRTTSVADASVAAGPRGEAKGPTDFFKRLYGAFVSDDQKDFPAQLRGQVEERQKRVVDILKKSKSSDVLTNTRLASKKAFDVLKYDIYTPKAPKTPESAKEIANKVIDMHAAVRRSYLGVITTLANEIAKDAGSFLSPRIQHVPDVPVNLPEQQFRDLPELRVTGGLTLTVLGRSS